jgi:hypothetical protein
MTTVTVTAEHIARGERDNCVCCPVALAIADAFPGAIVWVGGARALIDEVGHDVEADLPVEVEEFVCRFDDDGFGEPFTFELDYPETRPAA